MDIWLRELGTAQWHTLDFVEVQYTKQTNYIWFCGLAMISWNQGCFYDQLSSNSALRAHVILEPKGHWNKHSSVISLRILETVLENNLGGWSVVKKDMQMTMTWARARIRNDEWIEISRKTKTKWTPTWKQNGFMESNTRHINVSETTRRVVRLGITRT